MFVVPTKLITFVVILMILDEFCESAPQAGGLFSFFNPIIRLFTGSRPSPRPTRPSQTNQINCMHDDKHGRCLQEKQCTDTNGEPIAGVCSNSLYCCIPLYQCGAVIKGNNSILANKGYPDPVNSIANCQYNIEKILPSICQIRLDFIKFQLAPPNADTICEEDTFTAVGTTGVNPPTICGKNDNQHVYIELGAGSGTAKINVATTTATTERLWKIKVAQIPCDSMYKAPQYCLQYHTENSGIINSFNYQPEDGVHQIADQSYAVCLKTSEGFCAITYSSSDFSMSGNNTLDDKEITMGEGNCTTDFISFMHEDKTGNNFDSRHCGTKFGSITTYFRPFMLNIIANAKEPKDEDANNKGFSLKYNQIPC